MRLITHSDDALWATGFGSQLFNIMTRLKRARPDWEIGSLHWNYHGAPFQTAYGFQYLPDSGQGHYANAKFYIDHFQPDIYFSLYDIWVSGAFMPGLSEKAGYSKTKWLSYYVFDVERWSAPRSWQGIFDACDVPVAMSKYGQESVQENYGVEPYMIHHGVDLAAFPPVPKDILEKRRELLGNPEFVMGALFRNIFRKQPAKLLQAWSKVCHEYPDVKLLLNMKAQDNQGYDLAHYIHHYGLMDKVNEKGELLERGPIIFGEQISETWGVPISELNVYYQLCDAQILPTQGEGFGLPIIEGYAASGLPVIMSRNTTYDELVGDHGLPIKSEGVQWTRHEGAQLIPDMEDMAEQMRLIIDDKNLRRKFSDYNKEFVKQFDFDRFIIPEWLALIEKVVGEGKAKEETKPIPIEAK